ncbi:MAG: hypothetical protein ACYTF1_25895, partial [Planctomycetota bacterium]
MTEREELDSLRQQQGSLTERQELEMLRKSQGTQPTGLDSMRFEPSPAPAVTTGVADPMQATREAEFGGQPQFREQPPRGFMESLESVGSGFAKGVLDVQPDPSGSVLSQLAYKHRGAPSQTAGELLGYAVPYGLAAKGVGAIGQLPKIARAAQKLPGLVRAGVRGAATGAAA